MQKVIHSYSLGIQQQEVWHFYTSKQAGTCKYPNSALKACHASAYIQLFGPHGRKESAIFHYSKKTERKPTREFVQYGYSTVQTLSCGGVFIIICVQIPLLCFVCTKGGCGPTSLPGGPNTKHCRNSQVPLHIAFLSNHTEPSLVPTPKAMAHDFPHETQFEQYCNLFPVGIPLVAERSFVRSSVTWMT